MNNNQVQKIRIATRESPLAMWQAKHVCALIQQKFPAITVALVPMTTKGDQILDRALAKVGGKGLFIKELEQAMLADVADIAVHSLKDVPMEFTKEFTLSAMLEREVPNDALVSNKYSALKDLPKTAVLGTSSLRRRAILKKHFPNFEIKLLRGNLGTRLRKLDEGEYDAIVLACAGLIRMNLSERITENLSEDLFLPAPGQGVVAIETLKSNSAITNVINSLADDLATITCTAERAFAKFLQGGCEVPLAAHAKLDFNSKTLTLSALVSDPEGAPSITGSKTIILDGLQAKGIKANLSNDIIQQADNCGQDLAKEFITKGAMAIIEKTKVNNQTD